MFANDIFTKEDDQYIREMRRTLHSWPEGGFDTPRTLELVKGELSKMGVEYTDKIGLSSVVGFINYGIEDSACRPFTIAIRADMDALPVEEKTGLPFCSRHEGFMHACGHDAHTSMLLGTARVLKRLENELSCRVKLLFQACEESAIDKRSGAKLMCDDGVLDDVDVVIALHVDPNYDCGVLGLHHGNCATNSNPITVEFFGKTSHATRPDCGVDALAMGVKFINDYQYILSRRVNPTAFVASSVCSFRTDNDSYNVVADHAVIKMTLRTFDDSVNDLIEEQIRLCADNAAKEMGGTAKVQAKINYPSFDNDKALSDRVMKSLANVVGPEKAIETNIDLVSEDFAFFARRKPGVLFRLGVRNEEKKCTYALHSNYFNIDEDALQLGVKAFVQFVLDNQKGF